jgi:hypothetical protein
VAVLYVIVLRAIGHREASAKPLHTDNTFAETATQWFDIGLTVPLQYSLNIAGTTQRACLGQKLRGLGDAAQPAMHLPLVEETRVKHINLGNPLQETQETAVIGGSLQSPVGDSVIDYIGKRDGDGTQLCAATNNASNQTSRPIYIIGSKGVYQSPYPSPRPIKTAIQGT